MTEKITLMLLPLTFSLMVSCGTRTASKENSAVKDSSVTDSVVVDSENKSASALTVTDIEGNVYNTVQIGNKIWMKENLKTIKFNDGTPIQIVTDSTAWASLTSPACCWYNNEGDTYKEMYGALYNGFAASNIKICPEYWHVPSDAEWASVAQMLGGDKVAGGKLKESGYDYWVSPNMTATNEIGFSALPGGLRYYDGVFHDFGFSSYFWTSTESTPGRLWFRYMDYEYSDLFRFNNSANIGFSIRCVRDY